jgi:hypothetical protein
VTTRRDTRIQRTPLRGVPPRGGYTGSGTRPHARRSTRDSDPTRVRNQAALRTSRGREWIVVGALLSAICLGVLALQVTLEPLLAVSGALAVIAIFVAMIIVRVTVSPLRRRLVVLAVLLTLIALSTFVTLLLILAAVTV